jgi:pimeloyl-ACP methyl ester carboxylesterase
MITIRSPNDWICSTAISLKRNPGFIGIRDGCEKKIVWHDDKRQQRNLAIVYIHGFSASRMETWPLCDHLAVAMGANLFYTRLTGHGQDGYAMATATVKDWQNDGMEAVAIGRRLGRKIILMGTSTGGTLATWLAAQPSVAPLIHRLILLSPNFFPKNPMAAAVLWPPALKAFEHFFGGWRCFHVSKQKSGALLDRTLPLEGHHHHDAPGPPLLANRAEDGCHAGADDDQPLGPGDQRHPGRHPLPAVSIATEQAGPVQGEQGFGPPRAGR